MHDATSRKVATFSHPRRNLKIFDTCLFPNICGQDYLRRGKGEIIL